MSTYSIIKLSQLEGAKRIDAEFYQPEYLEFIDRIRKNNNWLYLGRLAKDVICGPFGSAILQSDYKTQGIPLIRVADLKDWFVSTKDLVFIEEELSESMKRYQVFPEDIVVSQRGTIAMFSLVTNEFPKWNISANLISIKKSEKINFFYLLVFLNSKFGQHQILRKLSGEVQPKITTDDVKSILVFSPSTGFQLNIQKYVNEALKQRKLSEELYQQAEALLLQELGLQNFQPQYPLSYTTTFSNIFNIHRIDAEYFQPIYEEVINRIKSYKNGFDKLLNCVENVKADFNPYRLPNKVFSYVELADINTSVGTIESSKQIKGDEAPSRARRLIKQGDVIVSRVEGSLEKVALVSKDFENSLASTGFFQFRPFKISSQVLLVLAKSLILQIQFKRECAGTILTAIPEKALTRFIIPILPDDIQQKISSLVQQSHKARQETKQLLEEAKRKVEEEIVEKLSF